MRLFNCCGALKSSTSATVRLTNFFVGLRVAAVVFIELNVTEALADLQAEGCLWASPYCDRNSQSSNFESNLVRLIPLERISCTLVIAVA